MNIGLIILAVFIVNVLNKDTGLGNVLVELLLKNLMLIMIQINEKLKEKLNGVNIIFLKQTCHKFDKFIFLRYNI